MDEKMMEKLLEYIDAKIAEVDARESSDGGLIEGLRVREIRKELFALIQ